MISISTVSHMALFWSGLALFVCLISATCSVYLYRTVYSPLGLYAAAWGMLVILYLTQGLFGFDFIAVRPWAWFIMIVSVVAFSIGSVIGTGMSATSQKKGTDPRPDLTHLPERLPLVMYLFVALGIIAIVIKWWILIDMFGSVPQAITNIGTVRARAVRGEFSYPVVSRILVLLLFPPLLYATFLCRKNRRYVALVFALLALLFFDDLSIAARGHTAFGFSIVAVGYLLTVVIDPDGSVRWSVGKVIASTILALLSMNLIFAIRSGFQAGLTEYVLVSFKSVYRYAVGPLPAFSWILPERSLSGYPGAYTFGGLYRILNHLTSPLLETQLFPRPPKPDAQIPLGFNTFPHLWALYSDFGFIGMLVLLCGLGAVSAYTYVRLLTNPTLLTHVATALILVFIVWTPRDVTTFWVSYWVVLITGIGIAYFHDSRLLSPEPR